MPTVALIGPELYPIPPIRGGAAELFIEKVAEALTGWRPVVIGVSDPDLPRRETRGRVEYHRVPLQGWRRWLYCRYRNYFPLYDREVARILQRLRPDLIHVHNRPLLALSWRAGSAGPSPSSCTCTTFMSPWGNGSGPPWGPPSRWPGLPPAATSSWSGSAPAWGWARGVFGSSITGWRPSAFASIWDQDAPRQQVREHYGLGDEPTVLFAGKLRESKGVHILVRAMTRVWEAAPRTVLVLVGGTEYGRGRTTRETPFMAQLRRDLAGAPGRVVLTGFIPPADMPRAYLLGDVFVGPSQIEEGLGLVFLEAAAAGLPIIATRQGGIPEVVRDGFNGLLLGQKDDAAELAAKIIGLLGDAPLRKTLGPAGPGNGSGRFFLGKNRPDPGRVL